MTPNAKNIEKSGRTFYIFFLICNPPYIFSHCLNKRETAIYVYILGTFYSMYGIYIWQFLVCSYERKMDIDILAAKPGYGHARPGLAWSGQARPG